MTDTEALKLAELEVERLIEVCHKSGLNYWQILKILLNCCCQLQMKDDMEWRMKQ